MKKIALITLICFFAFTNQALAHTSLESSNPEDGSTVSEQLKEITLTYESTIEDSSTFELQDENGNSIPLEYITVADNLMTGNPNEPLENGQYTVLWNIIGVDGHPIEGSFSFTIDAPEDESESEETAENQTDDAADPEIIKAETEEATDVQGDNSNLLLIGILVIVVLAVGSIIWLRRKK
ncbi:copper resistance CopC family protein [Oceanobacillus massiliensis]|uniref:copper resistance CopC family protein n=1 Tax=Oceanobacillus massiliensis TaxID=1465765 RepID=UPI003019632C